MSLALLERARQACLALAALLALGAAWVAGRNFQRPMLPKEESARLERVFPAPLAPKASDRQDRTMKSFSAITDRRLVPEAPSVPVYSGPPPFKLVAVYYNGKAPQDSSAVVTNSKGDIARYRVGETVKVDEAKLLSVYGLKARFLWQGREVELGTDSPKPAVVIGSPESAAPPAQKDYAVTPKEWENHLAHIQDYYNMVKLDANIEGGQKNGLKISYMDEKCPARQYGFQQGDVVYSVNGKSLTNLLEAAALVNSFTTPKPLSIDVGRGGKRYAITTRPEEKK